MPIVLKPIHWDILQLVRTLCYEGLIETRVAYIDPNDRILPSWQQNPFDTRFVLPDGVPEPLVRSCIFAVPFETAEHRWGKDGHNPNPALQYVVDRRLLGVTSGNRPVIAAFRNLFNDKEILCTIELAEDGQSYWWRTPSVLSALTEQDGLLVTSPYPVLKLTEAAHLLIDAKCSAGQTANEGGPEDASSVPAGTPVTPIGSGAAALNEGENRRRPTRGRKPHTDPKEDKRIADAWATRSHKNYADLERALGLAAGSAKRAIDRNRKRK